MINIVDLLPLFFAALVLTLKPGPYMLAISSLAASGNIRALLSFWLGSTISLFVMYILILTGLSAIPEGLGFIFIFLKAIAAVIFIFMGAKTIQQAAEFSFEEAEKKANKISTRNLFSNFAAGSALSLSNPYDIIFIFTAVPALVGVTKFSILDALLIRGTITIVDIIVISSYCIPILLIRKKLSFTLLEKIRFGCGVAMIGIGIFLIANILMRSDLLKSDLLNIL